MVFSEQYLLKINFKELLFIFTVSCTEKHAILGLKGTLNTILYDSHILGVKETGV